MKIQIAGGKINEFLGFESPLQKAKFFFGLFSFHSQILHTKLGKKSFLLEFEIEQKKDKKKLTVQSGDSNQ